MTVLLPLLTHVASERIEVHALAAYDSFDLIPETVISRVVLARTTHADGSSTTVLRKIPYVDANRATAWSSEGRIERDPSGRTTSIEMVSRSLFHKEQTARAHWSLQADGKTLNGEARWWRASTTASLPREPSYALDTLEVVAFDPQAARVGWVQPCEFGGEHLGRTKSYGSWAYSKFTVEPYVSGTFFLGQPRPLQIAYTTQQWVGETATSEPQLTGEIIFDADGRFVGYCPKHQYYGYFDSLLYDGKVEAKHLRSGNHTVPMPEFRPFHPIGVWVPFELTPRERADFIRSL